MNARFCLGPFLCPLLCGLVVLSLSTDSAFAALKVAPTFANVLYGPDPYHQKLDVYVPTQGKGPFPVVLSIHGGGWFSGDKVTYIINPTPYLNNGCAYVSIDYRLVQDAVRAHISPPVVAVLGDTRRALQYVRLHAADWNLDPNKIVVAGSSAGALSALYLACEGEQAKPDSSDPVERVSTKVLGADAEIAQSSLDPQRIHEWVPGCYWGYWAFEVAYDPPHDEANFNSFLADRDKWMPSIQQYSPDWLITKDTPPIYFSYMGGSSPLPGPGPGPTPSAALVHCPLWGIGFQKLAQEKGVECYLQYPGHPAEKYTDSLDFVLHQLGIR